VSGEARRAAPLPPFEALERVAARLRERGIPFALGASGLLYALGLVDRDGDRDLTPDAPLNAVRNAFDDVPHEFCGNSGIHTDHKLRLEGGEVELIVRMSLAVPGGEVFIVTLERGTWRGVPLGSLEAWAVAYALMGREARAKTAFDALEDRGADAADVAAMRAQPLPPELDARLRDLPVAPARP
jgi:hypothetical protein